MRQFIAIVLVSIVACICYGIIHDQITARISVEYFTIGHPMIIPTNNPTILGLLWGVIATWWVGAVLGILLAIAARFGKRQKRSALSLLKPIVILQCSTALIASIAGVVGYIAASNNWVWLVGHLAEDVPVGAHTRFLVALWIHSASYLGALVGGLILVMWVWLSRRKYPKPRIM